MKHYAENDQTVCGIGLFGDAKRLMGTTNALEVTCPICLKMNNGALGRLVKEEKRRLASLSQREKERESHLALKGWYATGVSWQEAHAMASTHAWHELEDEAGD